MPEVSQNDEETDSDIGRRNCGDHQRMDNPPGNQSAHGTLEDDEYVELQTRKWARKAKMWRVTIGTCACLLASWFMGYLGFSSVWVVLVAIGAYQVWDGHVGDLLQENLRYEALRFRKKRAHRTEETAEWLNTIINRWWVFVSESIFAQIKSNLDPLLNDCKPAILRGGKADSKKWCVLRLGEEEHVIIPDISSRGWQDCHSFLVDFPCFVWIQLVVKVKTKRIISTMTLATYEVPLIQVLQQKTLETVLRKKEVKGNTMPSILLRLQYTPLPPVILEPASVVRSQPDGAVDSEPCSRAGVLYVCVHSADGLSTADGRERPNPFCLVFSNGKKVKTTHFASHTCNPKWDSPVEFLVMDYSKTVISFAVWSWDSSKMADSSFLGLASLTLSIGEMSIVKRAIPVSVTPSPLLNGINSGVITVSVLFREAPSVAQSEMTVCKEPQLDIPVQMNRVVESSLASTAMFLSSVQDQQLWCGNARESIPASGQTDMIVELFLVRAKDLVSKDFNGYSDPYCEVKLNDECKFKTRVQRKTLNPYWDENVIVQMPNSGESLTVIVWDHDTFGLRDFLGSVSLSPSDMRRIAAKDCGEWLTLQNTISGELELKFRIISDEKEITSAVAPESPTEALANPVVDEEGPLAPTQPPDDCDTNKEPTFQTFRPTATTNTVPKTPEATRDREGEGSSPKLPTVRRPSASGPRPPPPLPPVVPTPEANPLKKSPSPSKASSSTVSSPSSDSAKGPQAQTPTSGGTPASGTHAYSSLRKMKNKVKKAFGQPLRRFRSEASVHEEKAKGLRERIRIERRKDDAYSSCTDIDSIPQDVLEGTASRAETELKPDNAFSFSVAPEVETKTRYYNVCGRVIQATGLDVKGANTLYCRIKLVSENCDQNSPKHKNGNAGRTIAKSKLLPANKNVPFNVDFKMENSSGISSLAKLSFDIRTASKEPFASKQITIQDLLEDVGVAKPGEQVRTCLGLDSGATLELVISFGKCTSEPVSQGQPNSVSKLLRSWSVHKIGKI